MPWHPFAARSRVARRAKGLVAAAVVGLVAGWSLHGALVGKPKPNTQVQETLAAIREQNQQLLRQLATNPQALSRPAGAASNTP